MTREEILVIHSITIASAASCRRAGNSIPSGLSQWIDGLPPLTFSRASLGTISIENNIWSFTTWRLLLMRGCGKWRNHNRNSRDSTVGVNWPEASRNRRSKTRAMMGRRRRPRSVSTRFRLGSAQFRRETTRRTRESCGAGIPAGSGPAETEWSALA